MTTLEWTVLTLSGVLLWNAIWAKLVRLFEELHYDKTPCSDGKHPPHYCRHDRLSKIVICVQLTHREA